MRRIILAPMFARQPQARSAQQSECLPLSTYDDSRNSSRYSQPNNQQKEGQYRLQECSKCNRARKRHYDRTSQIISEEPSRKNKDVALSHASRSHKYPTCMLWQEEDPHFGHIAWRGCYTLHPDLSSSEYQWRNLLNLL